MARGSCQFISIKNTQPTKSSSWFYQFFVDILKDKIKSEAENVMASAISSALDVQANSALVTKLSFFVV